MPVSAASPPPPLSRSFIEELRVRDYGCIQEATLRLTPLHALIGPNDSGKSTFLRALHTLSLLLAGGGLPPILKRALLSSKGDGSRFGVSSSTRTLLLKDAKTGFHTWQSLVRGTDIEEQSGDFLEGYSLDQLLQAVPDIRLALKNAQVLRLEPDALRAPHSLMPDSEPLRFVDERGTGLPALYDAILARDLPAYQAINAELCRLFPDVESIRLVTVDKQSKAIGVKLRDGTFVPAELMSEGLLYYLAFAILPHLAPTSLLLIEEPENGLHPARIAEVVSVLRAISRTTQVVLATHSPLVVNELQPDEVTVVTRSREHGTRATPIRDVPRFEERSRVYALGELWLSYADGKEESPLLEGGPRP